MKETAAARIRRTKTFDVDDIELLRDLFVRYNFAPGSPWDDFRTTYLNLPPWFRYDLDPMSDAYAAQQHRLWAAIAGVERPYDPQTDEETTPHPVDPVKFPGFYVRRDEGAINEAASQLLASALIMKHSGLKSGQRALEYGAGFGQTALHLARLGVNVDTVDISRIFCSHVRAQADFFGVPLTPFHGRFGWNPRGDQLYDFIWFFECFHHCVDFRSVVHELKRNLAPNGRLVLVGEGVMRVPSPIVPYPWGVRIESDVVAIVREKHWFELGFSEDFLVSLFTMAGFSAAPIECREAPHGEGYLFRHRGGQVDLGEQWLPAGDASTWHAPGGNGRWTKDESYLTVDATETFGAFEIEASSHHPRPHNVEILYGAQRIRVTLNPGERKTILVDAHTKAPRLTFRTRTLNPSRDSHGSSDDRDLGIYVHCIRYV